MAQSSGSVPQSHRPPAILVKEMHLLTPEPCTPFQALTNSLGVLRVSQGVWRGDQYFLGEAQLLRSLQRETQCDVKMRRLPDRVPPLCPRTRKDITGPWVRWLVVCFCVCGGEALLPSVSKVPSLGMHPKEESRVPTKYQMVPQ